MIPFQGVSSYTRVNNPTPGAVVRATKESSQNSWLLEAMNFGLAEDRGAKGDRNEVANKPEGKF